MASPQETPDATVFDVDGWTIGSVMAHYHAAKVLPVTNGEIKVIEAGIESLDFSTAALATQLEIASSTVANHFSHATARMRRELAVCRPHTWTRAHLLNNIFYELVTKPATHNNVTVALSGESLRALLSKTSLLRQALDLFPDYADSAGRLNRSDEKRPGFTPARIETIKYLAAYGGPVSAAPYTNSRRTGQSRSEATIRGQRGSFYRAMELLLQPTEWRGKNGDRLPAAYLLSLVLPKLDTPTAGQAAPVH